MKVNFEYFRSSFQSWHQMFEKAAKFATAVGKDRLIGISHSADSATGVITVWYWAEGTSEEKD